MSQKNTNIVSVDDPDATDYIGCQAICSKGIKALITGIAKMPWGVSFVGYTDDGTVWSSRNPEILPIDITIELDCD